MKYPCSVCAKPVRKRIISCEECGLWLHKKCDPTLKLENNSSSISKPCQNKSHDNLDNVWVEFPFDDDFLKTKKLLLLMKKLTMTLIKQIQLPTGKLSTNEYDAARGSKIFRRGDGDLSPSEPLSRLHNTDDWAP